MAGERIAILGCGRGLGWHLAKEAAKDVSISDLLLVSRNEASLEGLKQVLEQAGKSVTTQVADFAKEQGQQEALSAIQSLGLDRLIYVAGGGPFGFYGEKKWKDHLWSYQVSFLFPAQVLHWGLQQAKSGVKQLTLVGSSVAEAAPDPKASSYAASKHALFGLWSSVSQEEPPIDVRLFSPGYMDTPMLPPNAHPRHSGHPIWSPAEAAVRLWAWLQEESARNQHLRLPPYADGASLE